MFLEDREYREEKDMIIRGRFSNIEQPSGRSCSGRFLIYSGDVPYICEGMAPELKKNLPVIVEGTTETESETDVTRILVKRVLFNDEDKVCFIRFFSGSLFHGIGTKTAENIYESLNEKKKNLGKGSMADIPEDEIFSILDMYKVRESTKYLIYDHITGLKQRMSILDTVREYDGNYEDVERLYSAYKEKAVETLLDTPFKTASCGISFELADAVAYRNNLPAYDDDRLEYIMKLAAEGIHSTGSSCFTLKEFLWAIRVITRQSKYGPLPDAYLLSGIIKSRFLVINRDEDEMHIYTKRSYHTEEKITKEILRLQNSKESLGYSGYRGEKDLDPDQINAIGLLNESGIKVVTGGPGAGKTTLIKEFIEEYKRLRPEEPFFLCAPTGRAAVRISESSGYPAYTVHKLLGFMPFSRDQETPEIQYNKDNPLPKGLFVIDEMSMVSESLILRFLEAVPNGSTVLLSGDPRQLKSVEPGNVLNDIIDSGKIPTVMLTHIHRQQGDSAILDNYYRIKNFNRTLIEDSTFVVEHANSTDEVLSKVRELYKRYDSPDPYRMQIITFTKVGGAGRDAINNMILLEKRKDTDDKHYYGRSSYAAGDKVMMTANNYKSGYMNGDIGTVKEVTENGVVAEFYDGDREITGESFRDMEHAWACTVHKSQGSEYETVIIICDDEYKNMLYNSIVLTAITRARKQVYIITMHDAIYEAICTEAKHKRRTGLRYFLKNNL